MALFLWLPFTFFCCFFLPTNNFFTIALLTTTFDDHQHNVVSSSSSLNPPPPPLFPPPPEPLTVGQSKVTPFKPSIAVIVGVLSTILSVTFLLLLYAKHCKRGNYSNNNNPRGRDYPSTTERKNSGIDRGVIESLPIFRFKSLRGQKAEGLECAVCLNKFEPTEVLRLLPKCKHAFHVECVDTWLDAHSTCPLCRYRVDPEDILLVDERRRIFGASHQDSTSSSFRSSSSHGNEMLLCNNNARVSGRHSSAGERGSSSFLEVIVEQPGQVERTTTSFVSRRSLDSWRSFNRKACSSGSSTDKSNSGNEIVAVGCFDRPRKDELLLAEKSCGTEHRRLEHRIIVSGGSETGNSGPQQRWSDVETSDLLYLRSEMILSDSRGLAGPRRSRSSGSREGNNNSPTSVSGNNNNSRNSGGSGRGIINERSVSEITGLSRFRSNEGQQREQRQRQEGAVSRWLAWISHSQSQPAVPSSAAANSASSTTNAVLRI